jgi:hypothetical protein
MAPSAESESSGSIYSALPSATSIRVLTYLGTSGSTSGRLQCKLETFDLDYISEKSTYNALSYVWGKPTDTAIIRCDDALVAIRRSLYTALCNIWAVMPTTRIWADAICINQSDLDEKSTQVSSMHRIFAEAEDVLIWFGEPFDGSQELFQLLRTTSEPEFAQVFEQLTGHGRPWYRLPRVPSGPFERIIRAAQVSDLVSRLSCHEWFTRIWTLQEFAVARRAYVVCGLQILRWEEFRTGVARAKEYLDAEGIRGDRLPPSGNLLNYIENLETALATTKPYPERLLHLLVTNRDRAAFDGRDRVFALMNMPQLRNRPTITVDYSLSVDEVFADAAYSCIQSTHSLDILQMAGQKNRAQSIHPSWVPDWRDTQLLDRWENNRVAPPSRTHDSISRRLHLPRNQPGNIRYLVLSGALLATVGVSDLEKPNEGVHQITFTGITLTSGSVVDFALPSPASISDYFEQTTVELQSNDKIVALYEGALYLNGADLVAKLRGNSDLLYLLRKCTPCFHLPAVSGQIRPSYDSDSYQLVCVLSKKFAVTNGEQLWHKLKDSNNAARDFMLC